MIFFSWIWLRIFVITAFLVGLTVSFPGYGQQIRKYKIPKDVSSDSYLPGVIVFKVKQGSQSRSINQNTKYLAQNIGSTVQAYQVEQVFPTHQTASNYSLQGRRNQPASSEIDISNIYKLRVGQGENLEELINKLLEFEEVEYAEPYFLMEPLYVPSDPEANSSTGSQKHLAVIKAYQAWDIHQGDTSVVIGILDTGVELGHQDLDNIKYNRRDPINGKDDDNDGYIDNYLGWDMADQDNVPDADKDSHGTGVAGAAAAATNNNRGIAGTGFKSTYLPIKVFTSESNVFRNGYEAIVYAADHGCKVINLSWGSTNSYSKYAQDIINYAVLVKDAVVVAAAGNSGKNEYYYPASYENVLSVTNSDLSDKKNSAATYNYEVDLIAPGTNIYTTDNNDGYKSTGGTSFSSPIVAGAAALVRAKFPKLSAQQVIEQLRLSADDIYAVGTNKNYSEMLGYGRLNMQRALQTLKFPAFRVHQYAYDNGLGEYAFGGDTLDITTEIINFLGRSSAGARIKITSPSPYVTVLDSIFQVGVLDTFNIATNTKKPFRVRLHDDLPGNEELVFRLSFEDDGFLYSDYQYIIIRSSSDYLDLNTGEISVTVSSNGDIGYNPSTYAYKSGFNFLDNLLASQMGLAIGISQDSLSDNLISDFTNYDRNWDFNILEGIRLIKNTPYTIEARSVFSDEGAENPLGLRIEQSILGGDGSTKQNFFVFVYRIVNLQNKDIEKLHTGLYADWNIGNPAQNKAAWLAAQKLGYVYSTTTDSIYTGISLLSNQDSSYFAIDLQNYNGNTPDLGIVFPDSSKFNMLANGQKTEAGVLGEGNDVAQMVGSVVDTLKSKRGIQIAFAIVAGKNLEDLQSAVENAHQALLNYNKKPDIIATVKTCNDSTATINPPDGETFRFYRDPYATEFLHEGSSYTTGSLINDTAIYVINMDLGYEGKINKIEVLIEEPETNFSAFTDLNPGFRNDTLYLDESNNALLPWKDESKNANSWKWNLGNGYTSVLQNPKTRYQPGEYQVRLITTSEPGCLDTLSKKLTVVQRGPVPKIADQYICKGESVKIEAQNAGQLFVYSDSLKTQLLGNGASFTTKAITTDTSFFVVNADSTYESLPKRAKVRINPVNFSIAYALDTISLTGKNILNLKAIGSFPENQKFTWEVDNDILKQGKEVSYDFTEKINSNIQNFDLKLSATVAGENELSCNYTEIEKVHLGKSPTPTLKTVEYCSGARVEIEPAGGKLFYFYEDKELTKLLHKGNNLIIENFQRDTTIYITNADSLRESNPIAAQALLYKFADFNMSSDTIALDQTNEVTFEAFKIKPEETQTITWQWDFGNNIKANTQQSVQQFDKPGIFIIQLWAQNQKGCSNYIEKKLVVNRVTGVDFTQENLKKILKLYPNPNAGRIRLENEKWQFKDLEVSLADVQGRIYFSRKIAYKEHPTEIDLNPEKYNLQNGLYFLKIETNDQVFVEKIVINSGK